MTARMVTIDEIGGEAEWAKLRLKTIGGSDTPAILGVDRWRGAYETWLSKKGRIGHTPVNEAMGWGHRLEEAISQEFAERTGFTIEDPKAIFYHADYEWMHYTPDRFIVTPGAERGLLEVKNRSIHMGSEWDDTVPPSVTAQVVHGLEVLDMDWGYAAALIGGNKLVFHRVERDAQLAEQIVLALEEFWQYMQGSEPPPMDGLDTTGALLNEMFRPKADLEIQLSGPGREAFTELVEVKSSIKKLTKQKTYLENVLKSELGDATVAQIGDVDAVTWKETTTNRFNQTAFKKANAELAAEFTETTVGRRFLLPKHSTKGEAKA